jgi:hypothetical protein
MLRFKPSLLVPTSSEVQQEMTALLPALGTTFSLATWAAMHSVADEMRQTTDGAGNGFGPVEPGVSGSLARMLTGKFDHP